MRRLFPVQVGDRVMISPEYWRQSGNGSHFSEPYKSNGQDYIYTVTHIDGNGDGNSPCFIRIDGHGGWDNEHFHFFTF